MMDRLKVISVHLLGWLLFVGLVIAFITDSPATFFNRTGVMAALVLFAGVYVGLFYLNSAVLMPRLYFRRKVVPYLLVIVILLTGVYWLKPYDRLLRQNRPPREERHPPFRRPPPDAPLDRHRPPRGGPVPFDITSLVLFLAVWSSSTALQVNRRWRTTERRALQAERDKTAAELSFLKAQVNPHFLFNTLNNIYSLSIVKSEKTPQAILKLSGILHYITDEVQHDFVPLQSEVDCVKNYIELQQLRLTNKVDVQFEVTGNPESKEIAPLLFMTFIENAFKYGISTHEQCLIEIRIAASKDGVLFYCRNRMMVKAAAEERTGIGISNAKKRLDYLYPEKHSLNIDTAEGHFTVHLHINR